MINRRFNQRSGLVVFQRAELYVRPAIPPPSVWISAQIYLETKKLAEVF